MGKCGVHQQRIDDIHHVAEEVNSNSYRNKLESLHKRKIAQNKTSLIKRLVNLKYKDENFVVGTLKSHFRSLVNRLSPQ